MADARAAGTPASDESSQAVDALAAGSDLVVAFDGVLYNAADLAITLSVPAVAGSTGVDPVALLAAAYRRWGDALASRLDGDFAFVIWDPAQARAVAATDPAGVRPLHVVHEPGLHFSFASEGIALGQLLGLDLRIPESRVVEQTVNALELLGYPEPLVCGVHRLPAAHGCVARSRELVVSEYWSPGLVSPPGLRDDDVDGWVEGFSWHLQQAVAKRMTQTATGQGVMFSGGLDSSSVLALAYRHLGVGGIPTFSLVDSNDPDCPETRAIERMNRFCDTAPTRIDVAACAGAATQALAIIGAAPRPMSGRAAFLHACYARASAQGVQVVMDGLDADALLSYSGIGASLLRQGRFRDFQRAAGDFSRLRNGRASNEFALARGLLKVAVPAGLRRVVSSLRSDVARADWLTDSLLNRETAARFGLKARLAGLDAMTATKPGEPAPGLKSSMASLVTRDGIARTNARAAQHGLELRHPFMDRALMDFCAWLPLDVRLREGWTKWVMRKGMEALLPHDIAWRRDKTHIGAKFDRIVLQPVLERLMLDLPRGVAAVQAYVDRDAVLALANRWQRGEISAVWRLTPVLLLEHWLQGNRDNVAWGH